MKKLVWLAFAGMALVLWTLHAANVYPTGQPPPPDPAPAPSPVPGIVTNIFNGMIAATTNSMATPAFTNATVLADGVLNGTNGVFFTRNGTNYWLLLD